MNKTIRIGALVAASALLLAACGDAPDDEPGTTDTAEPTTDVAAPAEPVDYKPCIVSDQGGFDDRSFNQAGFEGLQEVAEAYGMDTSSAESADDTEYDGNITELIASGCDMVITVGFLLGDATATASAANPDVNFAIIDFAYDEPIDNVKPLLFDTDEAAFLAGYAAAAVSETGTVATFGGAPIPPVTIFMDGFLSGVNYHNETEGTDVTVLGWDGTDGSFTGNFDDQTAGQNLTQGFIDQGADIILPVAGPVGLGAAAAAREAGNVWIIGVDQDWSVTAPEYADLIFTSIMKNMGPAVFDVVEATAIGDGFSNEPYFGNLENDGVGLAGFGDAPLPDGLEATLAELEAGIIDGSITP